jgi:exopolyphosphatase/guanosine-5'-triphosphate,3'-diphosphate pyrophosphatase
MIEALPQRYRQVARRIIALLRLAVLFRRGRRADALPRLQLDADGQRLRLSLPRGWLHQHPLTQADLLQEQAPMAELGLTLEIVPV